MIRHVSLSVTFPTFGNNYYSQNCVFRQPTTLVSDPDFSAFLVPSATQHFTNEVVGLNDQIRFLNDILASHLLALETRQPALKSRPSMQQRSA